MDAIEVSCCPCCGNVVLIGMFPEDLIEKFRCSECGDVYNTKEEAEECCPIEEETQIKE
jgi:Zn ribbon nucleic-acid-binding protein